MNGDNRFFARWTGSKRTAIKHRADSRTYTTLSPGVPRGTGATIRQLARRPRRRLYRVTRFRTRTAGERRRENGSSKNVSVSRRFVQRRPDPSGFPRRDGVRFGPVKTCADPVTGPCKSASHARPGASFDDVENRFLVRKRLALRLYTTARRRRVLLPRPEVPGGPWPRSGRKSNPRKTITSAGVR